MSKPLFIATALLAALIFSNCEKYDSKNGGSLTIEVKVQNGENFNNVINEVRAIGYLDSNQQVIIASAPFENGGFKITLPKKIDERLLEPMYLENYYIQPSLKVSNRNVNSTVLDVLYGYKNNAYVSIFQVYGENVADNNKIYEIFFTYVDKDVKITGTQYEYDNIFYIDNDLKKGWNVVYSYANGNELTVTTKKPNIEVIWYFVYDR